MGKKLALTDEQKSKVLAINLDKAKKIDALKSNENTGKRTLAKFIADMEEERDAELKKVFTTGQFEKWIKMKMEQKKKFEKENEGNDSEEYIDEGKMQSGC